MRLVEVPISVHIPPNIEAKDNGMRSFDGETSRLPDHSSTRGISAATIGVLLMNAERPATGKHSHKSATRIETFSTLASA